MHATQKIIRKMMALGPSKQRANSQPPLEFAWCLAVAGAELKAREAHVLNVKGSSRGQMEHI